MDAVSGYYCIGLDLEVDIDGECITLILLIKWSKTSSSPQKRGMYTACR